MSDGMATYDVSQIDKLVSDNINGDDKIEVPEEITHKWRTPSSRAGSRA